MVLGRRRREERRDERETFGRGGNATRYKMQQKMLSIGDDFVIENEQGDKVYKVDGKIMRIRKTFVIEDMQGNTVCKLQKELLHVKDTMAIDGPDGKTLAKVKKAMVTPLRERWHVEVKDGPDMDIQGNIVDHEYEVEADGHKVGEVSKKWFRVRDSYGVEIAPGQNDVLILAATVAVDAMAHPMK